MKRLLIALMAFSISYLSYAQYKYEPSKKYPYGRLNPKAPKEVADYEKLIGTCNCKSISRLNQTEWADSVDMTWTFKYIMDGMAVQDETLKADGIHSGSIRQFNADSSTWYVHYYAANAPSLVLSSWEGGKVENGDIVLYKDSPSPNGLAGDYRLKYSNISDEGYNWVGAWVDKARTIEYPTWKIFCKRSR